MTALLDTVAALSLWCSLVMAGLTDLYNSPRNDK